MLIAVLSGTPDAGGALSPSIVIPGTSSGIGRSTARTLARQGATVVLAARRVEALDVAAWECEQLGGPAMPMPADVRDEVQELAKRALDALGRIDVWVNGAAVTLLCAHHNWAAGSKERLHHSRRFAW